MIDMTNQRFGSLLVIKQDSERGASGEIKWICKCDCGNIKSIKGAALRSGNTKSCGCLHKKQLSERNKKNSLDLTGQKFGKLTVIKRSGKVNQYGVYWLCECSCKEKNIVEVLATNLKNNRILSCGCTKTSHGEEQIRNMLIKNNIEFISEYRFNDLYGETYPLRFDFAIIDNCNNVLYLIECDGEQHRDKDNIYYSETTAKYDIKKNNYCKEHNIPLIRIPYCAKKKINEEDLFLQTTNFLI